MAIFNSYVKLPEGIWWYHWFARCVFDVSWGFKRNLHSNLLMAHMARRQDNNFFGDDFDRSNWHRHFWTSHLHGRGDCNLGRRCVMCEVCERVNVWPRCWLQVCSHHLRMIVWRSSIISGSESVICLDLWSESVEFLGFLIIWWL